jgi:diguanylate cyclase (GGDEF)-like protein
MAGLATFETPTLEAVEKRRLQLWALTICLLFAFAVGLLVLTLAQRAELPGWMTPRALQAALVGFVILFCAYAIEKEIQLRTLSRLLVEERILAASLTNRLREVTALLAAAKAMNLILEIEEVLETILRCALDLLTGSDGSVMLTHGTDELRTVAMLGASPARGARVRFGEGIAGRVAASREAVLITGVIEHEPSEEPRLGVPPPMSSMSVPLIHRDTLLGVLNVNAAAGREFTEYDLRALSLFGEQAAGALANAQLLEEQRLLATQTLYQALHDSLTNLPNRSLFLDRVGHALMRRRSPGRGVAVLFLDLDDFKLINDSLGHAAGDDALVALAERLRARVRSADTVARFGGDEFGILVEDVSGAAEAVAAGERILKAFDEPFFVGGRSIALHASIGIALEGQAPLAAEELVRNADTAMHHGKASGKQRMTVFDERMHRDAVERLDLEAEMRKALDRGQFLLHYQPIMRLDTRELAGVEALVRWAHPSRGTLAAANFMPLAQRLGILGAIDRWVLAEACRAATALVSEIPLPRHFSMHVNVSPLRVQEPGFADEVIGVLSSCGVDPGRLVLEITESALLGEAETVVTQLERLKSSGVRLALDDFGTGFSSLSHLRRFPVDVVKIDRIFIEGMAKEAVAIPLVQAILTIGKRLGINVVAEGIEKQAEVETLLRAGCTMGQGYLLSSPLSRQALTAFLRRSPASTPKYGERRK